MAADELNTKKSAAGPRFRCEFLVQEKLNEKDLFFFLGPVDLWIAFSKSRGAGFLSGGFFGGQSGYFFVDNIQAKTNHTLSTGKTQESQGAFHWV